MAFSKGQTGNRNGRPKSAKEFSDALRLTLAEIDETDPDKPKRLRKVANALVKQAEDGNVQAIKEIADRIDGKSDQTLNVNQSGEITLKSAAISVVDALVESITGQRAGVGNSDAMH